MKKKKSNNVIPNMILHDNQTLIDKVGKISDINNIANIITDYYINDCQVIKEYIKKGLTYDEALIATDNLINSPETIDTGTQLLCVNNWYYGGRQLYKFDESLSELLDQQVKEDLEISCSVLQQLPHNHFYVEINYNKGFFFTLIENENIPLIVFTTVNGNELSSYILNTISGKTISECITADAIKSKLPVKYRKTMVDNVTADICYMMQYVTYLATINAEIVPKTKSATKTSQKPTTPPNTSNNTSTPKTTDTPKPHRTKSQVSEVGYRFGSAYRASVNSNNNIKNISSRTGVGKGTPKSPHLRRSHFHSFWVGSGEDKKLTVKWIQSIFIHGDEPNTNITTIHTVK